MKHPDDLKEFMSWFKNQSERHFETIHLERDVAGLQHQPGTKWRRGLSMAELAEFQKELGFEFPVELIEFYRIMNGTDRPGVNLYAEQGMPYHYAPIYYSYPDHLPNIKQLIQQPLDINGLTIEQMKIDGIPSIFPITDYYYMIIDNITNPVYNLSIAHKNHDLNQPYVFGKLWTDSLKSWLIKDAFFRSSHVNDLVEYPDKPRIINYWTTTNDS